MLSQTNKQQTNKQTRRVWIGVFFFIFRSLFLFIVTLGEKRDVMMFDRGGGSVVRWMLPPICSMLSSWTKVVFVHAVATVGYLSDSFLFLSVGVHVCLSTYCQSVSQSVIHVTRTLPWWVRDRSLSSKDNQPLLSVAHNSTLKNNASLPPFLRFFWTWFSRSPPLPPLFFVSSLPPCLFSYFRSLSPRIRFLLLACCTSLLEYLFYAIE